MTLSQHAEKTERIFLGVAGEFAKIQFRTVSHHVSHVHSREILDLAEYLQGSEDSENEHFFFFFFDSHLVTLQTYSKFNRNSYYKVLCLL